MSWRPVSLYRRAEGQKVLIDELEAQKSLLRSRTLEGHYRRSDGLER